MPNYAEILEAAKPEIGKMFAPMESFLRSSKAGQLFADDVWKGQYIPTLNKALEAGVKEAKQYGVPGGLIGPQPGANSIMSKASNTARRVAFGHNDAVGVGLVKAAYKEKGPVYAAAFQDHIAMLLHDNVESVAYLSKDEAKKGLGSTTKISEFKNNVKRVKGNPWRADNLDNPSIAAVYNPPGKGEKAFQHITNIPQLAAIAIPHATQQINTMLNAPLLSLAKAIPEIITPGGFKNAADALTGTGALGSTFWEAFKETQEFSSGKIAQSTNPTVGYWLNKVIHSPGFNAVRKFNIVWAGTAAKYVAEDMGRELMTGSKRAENVLQRMNIDPALVKAQQGKINPGQLGNAIFKFVDDNIFLDTKMARSYYAQSSPFFRLVSAFHGFTAQQGLAIYKAISDPNRTAFERAQMFAVLGVAFPLVGEVVDEAERFARGQDLDVKEKVENLEGKHGLTGIGAEYLTGLSHVAAFGVGASYIRSTLRSQLPQAMLGPKIGMATQFGTDAVQAAAEVGKNTGKRHKTWSRSKQLGRDVLEDTLPDHIGQVLVHRFLPTRAEEAKRHPKFHPFRRKREE